MQAANRDLPKATVPSVIKAARLLDEVAASRGTLTLADLAARLELPKSSTLSLCTSLTLCGLLQRFDDGSYHLGTHLVDLAHAYLSRTDLTQQFGRAWDSLQVMPEESAVLAVLALAARRPSAGGTPIATRPARQTWTVTPAKVVEQRRQVVRI